MGQIFKNIYIPTSSYHAWCRYAKMEWKPIYSEINLKQWPIRQNI